MTIDRKAKTRKENKTAQRVTFWLIMFFTAVLAGQIVPAFFR